jgi:hypothetical protein
LKNCLAIEPLLLSDLEHEHDLSVVSVEVREERPLDGPRFFRWLNAFVQQNGETLLRAKGILSLAGEARRWVFHGVHMTLDGRPGRPWGTKEPRTSAIVFIGRGLDPTRIRNEIADLTWSDTSLVAYLVASLLLATGKTTMTPLLALTTSIAVLGGLDTYLTATVLPIPVWVTFIAWASFFACGGGSAGFVKSVASNWVGVIISSLCLLAIAAIPGSAAFAGVSVGIGSGAMILASSHRALGFPPAIVFGFASTVGTVAATGHPITDMTIGNPALIAAFSMLVGASFGFVSEKLADVLAARQALA